MSTKLHPIGTRVSHFDGGPYTHGKGKIVAYNEAPPNQYLKSHFQEGVEMAAKAGLLDGVVDSFYDGERCPYVIQWDPSDKYPQGYKDVYEPDSIRVLPQPETT